MSLISKLNSRVDVYEKVEHENELEEKDYIYEKTKTIWAEILQSSGNTKNGQGNTTYADISHRIIIRENSIKSLTNDMYFIFKGQRYDIRYFNPNFKYKNSIEIFCSLVVE